MKLVLKKIYYSLQRKNNKTLRLEKKPNFCQIKIFQIDTVLEHTIQNQKTPSFFPWPSMPLKTKPQPQGLSYGVPSMPRNIGKVQKYLDQ